MKNNFFTMLMVCVCMLSCPLFLKAQQGNIWYFGKNAGLDFTGGSPTVTTNGSLNTVEGCASVSDALGNILFYTDGKTVYDKNDNVMPNGTGLNGHSSSTQSAIIVPHPGNANQYFVVTVADQYHNPNVNGVDYSIVDMSLGLNGEVTSTKNVNLVGATIATERVTSICYENAAGNPEFWVLTNVRSSNNYYAFNITSSGINTTPVITTASSLGLPSYGTHANNYVGYLKASSDGTMVFKANRDGNASLGELLNFDVTNGTFNTGRRVNVNRTGYGVEFSPDNQILYAATFGKVYQYDPSQTTTTGLTASENLVFTKPSGATELIGALQLGPDGKIYVCNGHEGTAGSSLDVINDPNTWQSGSNTCDYVNNQITLPTGINSYMGLPTFPNCYVAQGCDVDADFEINVDGCAFNFTDASTTASTTTIVGWLWTFGDGQSSTEQNPTHNYLDNGTYTVCLKVISTDGTECCVDEQCHEIDVECDEAPCTVEPYFNWDFCWDDCVFDFNGFALNYGTGQVGGWLWDFGDGTTAVGKNPSHTFPGPGSYEVCLTIFLFTPDGSCCEVKVCENVDVDCGEGGVPKSGDEKKYEHRERIEDATGTTSPLELPDVLQVFPNPSNNGVTINFFIEESSAVTISIIDANGRVVKSPVVAEQRATGRHHVNVDVSDLEPGIYLVQYQDATENTIQRISIQR